MNSKPSIKMCRSGMVMCSPMLRGLTAVAVCALADAELSSRVRTPASETDAAPQLGSGEGWAEVAARAGRGGPLDETTTFVGNSWLQTKGRLHRSTGEGLLPGSQRRVPQSGARAPPAGGAEALNLLETGTAQAQLATATSSWSSDAADSLRERGSVGCCGPPPTVGQPGLGAFHDAAAQTISIEPAQKSVDTLKEV